MHYVPVMSVRRAAAAVLLAATVAPAAARAQLPGVTGNPWLDRRPLNIAHRGGAAEFPDNTPYAYAMARAAGADVLETDVYLTKDGHVVALHDATVDRTTNGTGKIEDLTLAQVQRLDAAYWFVPGRGTVRGLPADAYPFRGVATAAKPAPDGFAARDFRIPTLDEVLQRHLGALVNVELKPSTQPGELELAVARVLARLRRTDDVIVVSFLDTSLELFKAFAPNVHTATPTVQAALALGTAQGELPGLPSPRHVAAQVPPTLGPVTVVSADTVADAHRNRLAVHVWTVNDEASMRRLLDMGVDGVMTDRPALLERVLTERGTPQPAAPRAGRTLRLR